MDVEEFERLYAAHAEPLFSFFAYRTGDLVLADDLLADTFERVFKARRGFDPRRGDERSWLYTIALNVLRDHARRRDVQARVADELAAAPRETSGTGGVVAVEERQSLLAALAALGAEELEAVSLRYGADLTLREIAEVTGSPISTVDSRISRALQALRRSLE